MIIKDVTIKNFGKLKEKEITFSPGLNVVYGTNESGKTTLHTFIRSTLFGMRRQRGRASKRDLYSRYEPKEDPIVYGGSMHLDVSGDTYCIERNFAKNDTRMSVYRESDGARPEGISELLGGIGERVFDNTVSIPQMESVTGEGLAEELRNYMAGSGAAADGSLDVSAAEAFLKKKRKEVEAAMQRKQETEERRIRSMDEDISRLELEAEEIRTQINDLDRENAAGGSTTQREKGGFGHLENTDMERNQENDAEDGGCRKVIRLPFLIFTILFATLTFFLYFRQDIFPANITLILIEISTALAIIFLILTSALTKNVPVRKQKKRTEDEDETITLVTAPEENKKYQWTRELLLKQLSEKEMQANEWKREREEAINRTSAGHTYEQELQGIALASETLKTLSAEMQNRFGYGLQERTGEILSEITSGKYTGVSIDSSLQMVLRGPDGFCPAEYVSRGTLEQLHFALRYASGEILCADETMPVILDEAFAQYDDLRLIRTLSWLGKQKRQIILFTCQRREPGLLSKYGIPHQMIRM